MNVLITAGGNTEKIDEVRMIRNAGTGTLGALTAEKLLNADDSVRIFYVCDRHAKKPSGLRLFNEPGAGFGQDESGVGGGSKSDEKCINGASIMSLPEKIADRIMISYADDVTSVEKVVTRVCAENRIDAVIHSMAISDYRVKNVTTAYHAGKAVADAVYVKRKKAFGERLLDSEIRAPLAVWFGSEEGLDKPSDAEEKLTEIIKSAPNVAGSGKVSSDLDDVLVVLEKAPKIISMYRTLAPNAVVVGFKLLSDVAEDELIRVGHALLKKNDCDYVLANDMKYLREGRHIGHLIERDGAYTTFDGKDAIATAVADAVLGAKTE